MLSHVHIGVTDFQQAYPFYAAVMAALDLDLRFSDPDKGWAAWQKAGMARPLLIIGEPFDGEPATPGNGQMTALLASSRSVVDRAHAIALAQGGSCDGKPGPRPQYHADYYGAYFRDLDGNKLCVVCHEAVG